MEPGESVCGCRSPDSATSLTFFQAFQRLLGIIQTRLRVQIVYPICSRSNDRFDRRRRLHRSARRGFWVPVWSCKKPRWYVQFVSPRRTIPPDIASASQIRYCSSDGATEDFEFAEHMSRDGGKADGNWPTGICEDGRPQTVALTVSRRDGGFQRTRSF